MVTPVCLRHREEPVVAVCARCGEGLCDACFLFELDRKPLCAPCASHLELRPKLDGSRLVVFGLVTAALAFWISRWVTVDTAVMVWVTAALLAGVALYATLKSVKQSALEAARIVRREPGDDVPPHSLASPAHPYRARLARTATRPASALSARTTAFLVGTALVTSAVVVPVSLHLPHWIEFELVLVAWWAMLVVFLTVLLYRGTRLREDHAFRFRWKLPGFAGSSQDASRLEAARRAPVEKSGGRSGGIYNALDIGTSGCADAEGCGGVLVGVILVGVALAAAWLLVELAFPALFFLLYWLVIKAIARVANDRHDCAGHLARAARWGIVWSTVYAFPFAVVGWAVHLLVAAHGHHL